MASEKMVMKKEWKISNGDSQQFLASGKFPVLFYLFFVHSQAGLASRFQHETKRTTDGPRLIGSIAAHFLHPVHLTRIHSVFSANFCFSYSFCTCPSAYSAFALCSALLCFGVAKAMEVVFGAAANIISEVCKCVIGPLVQLIKDVIHLDQNTRLLQEKLTTARAFVDERASQFQRQQRDMPVDVNEGLEKLRESLEHAQGMINRSQQRQGCLDRSFCKPRLCRQIRKCKLNIVERRSDLEKAISTARETQGVVSSAPLQAGALLQPVPPSGYVGSGIISAEKLLNTWLEDAQDHQFRVIGAFGMGGVGKTSLLTEVYNSHKKGNVFEEVIWLTIAQKFSIPDLQSIIAKEIKLDLGSSSSNAQITSAVLDVQKKRLSNYLKEKKFLLVLDDVWKSIQLEELGIPLGNDKGSKVVISTRRRDVIREMGADDSYCIPIRPLSPEEGWQLFCTKAFKTRGAPTKRIEDLAIQIAEECKGLPLAINVVAAAMIGNTNADEWDLALSQMKSVDPRFGTMFSETIDELLYKKLQWSYDLLPDYLKNCFLYCGAFSEDAWIDVERLVEMWIGEGMVNSRDKRQLMDVGRRYVKQLVERCLFEYVDEMLFIKVHDIVRDMALYIAEKEGKCLFRTSQKLDEFPAEQVMDDCKRIAIRYYNDTAFLPTDLRCPELRTLILAQNEGLREVPNGFLLNLTSLKVLDLSCTRITSLPDSMWQLKQLEFVGLNDTKISSLPAEICNLSRLQFLHLSGCTELESLPCTIEKLKNLKHLDLDGCDRLAGIPGEICQLTSLNKLELAWSDSLGVDEAKSGMCSLKDFTNFPNLMELSVRVKQGKKVDGIRSGIKLGIMGTWLEMKHLTLFFDLSEDGVMEDLPPDMQNMKNLHLFELGCYGGISLPNCICDFQRLESLYLGICSKLQELPPLERLPVLRVLTLYALSQVRELGIRGSVGGFPMLERLTINLMDSLESISNVVWTEATLPKLQSLSIRTCRSLKRLPIGIEKLSNLKDIEIDKDVWERSIAADTNIKICLEKRVRIW